LKQGETTLVEMVFPYMLMTLMTIFALVGGRSTVFEAGIPLVDPYSAYIECKIPEDPNNKCLPSSCSRHVMDGVFEESDIIALHEIAKKGMSSRGPSQGGPTILDINTGFVRDTKGLENLFTRDETDRIFTDDDFAHYGKIITKLRETVMTTMNIGELYFTAPTFITRLDGDMDWQPQEIHDEYWHPHADRNNTAHYHYSGLLYMSSKGKDFTGGDVVFYNADSELKHPRNNEDVDLARRGVFTFEEEEQRVEPRAGRMVIFTSGHENPHKVERLLSGQRFVLAFWFTCDEKRAFQIFLDGAAHTSFSQGFANDLKKRAGAGKPQQSNNPEEPSKKKRKKRRSFTQQNVRKEQGEEL
jgi:hypothetical protein